MQWTRAGKTSNQELIEINGVSFYTSHVVQDFFHQQYHLSHGRFDDFFPSLFHTLRFWLHNEPQGLEEVEEWPLSKILEK